MFLEQFPMDAHSTPAGRVRDAQGPSWAWNGFPKGRPPPINCSTRRIARSSSGRTAIGRGFSNIDLGRPLRAFPVTPLGIRVTYHGGSGELRGRRRIPALLQDVQHRLLNQSVEHRGDAQLPDPAAGLRDVHPSHWLCLYVPFSNWSRMATLRDRLRTGVCLGSATGSWASIPFSRSTCCVARPIGRMSLVSMRSTFPCWVMSISSSSCSAYAMPEARISPATCYGFRRYRENSEDS